MTIEERKLTFAYALITSAEENVNHAYRVLADDGYRVEDSTMLKCFVEIDGPMSMLKGTIATEMAKRTDFEKEKENA